MKKFFVLFAMMAIVSASAIAQDQAHQDPQKAAKDKTEWDQKVKSELKMSADQSAKFDALNKEFAPKMEAIKSDASLNDEARKEKKMALMKEKQTRLAEFLSADQMTTYKRLVDEKMKKEMAKH